MIADTLVDATDEIREDLATARDRRRRRRDSIALGSAAVAFLVAFLVTAIVLYNARDLATRIADYQLTSCEHGNTTRHQIATNATVLTDLITTVLPPLRGAERAEFLQAKRVLAANIATLGPLDCKAIVPH